MRSFNLLQPPSITSGSSTVLEMERNGERGGDEMEIRRDLERDGERWREMERTWRELETSSKPPSTSSGSSTVLDGEKSEFNVGEMVREAR